MSKDKKTESIKEKVKKPAEKKKVNDIDRQLDQTFPASDPPSYSQPGRDKIKDKKKSD
jgi:hypothetical protein